VSPLLGRLSLGFASRFVVAGALVVGLSTAAPAAALECPAGPGASAALASIDAEARLQFLQWAFDREIRDVDLWSWTWGSAYVGATTAQGIIAGVTHDHGLRTDLTVGSAAAGFGALSLFGLPLRVTLPLRDARRLWSDADRCRLLAAAEATFAEVVDREKMANGWIPHAGNVLLNAGIALLLGWGFKRWESAGISGAVGVAVGEANIFTQPHRLPRLLDGYRAGRLEENNAPAIALSGGPGAGVSWAFHF
jgi:hypothetical protein